MQKRILVIAAGLALIATGLPAQIGGGTTVNGRGGGDWVQFQFQQAGTIGAVRTGGGIAIRNYATVVGSPVSATEERKSVQKLGDGTEISTSDTDQFYRDRNGRTRVEETLAGRTAITIMDPVARVAVNLNTVTKIARKTAFGGGVNQTAVALDLLKVREQELADKTNAAPAATVAGGGRGGRGMANNTVFEDLGVQMQNGVLATGTRNTRTIPQGQIGNNRDIHVVDEHWYSEDLQMLVKSINSDPRFGETTYELTNISQDDPDPALFQIPADYTIVDMSAGGRGGRGVGPIVPVTVINK
jgi:hypothetical protein